MLRSNYELQIKNGQGTQNIWNTKEGAKPKADIIILTTLIIASLGSDAVLSGCNLQNYFLISEQPLVGQGPLIFEASR